MRLPLEGGPILGIAAQVTNSSVKVTVKEAVIEAVIEA